MLRRGGRMMPSLRRALIILPLWTASVIWMWAWWLTAANERFMPLFIPLTMALFYEFVLLPSVFLYFVIKAKAPNKRIAKKGHKVAVISLCVPSTESMDIIESQLKAMSEIIYPHDSWILDEGNSDEIKLLAKKYGVRHFSRKGIRAYNMPIPPFQKKTKAGNVNAWINHVKRRKYDFFVQLDIDHIPKPNYLHKTLGYFRDSKVAWVQAPSVYKNLNNWIARGSAEQELVLQGPLQMGFYGHSNTPFIIGSHCTYRMSAIKEIGGFQPTRAEDHLDTVYLAHHGYSGVFLPEIIAEGDGPETLSTYLAQQFAWAYSMFQVLQMHTPKLIKAMPWRRRWQFLFAQTWYPLWTISYVIMFMTPVVALWLNRDIVSVEPFEMLIHFMPTFVGGFAIWWASRPLMQPKNLFISWRGMILHAVRWPIIFRAILTALFKIKKPYMITPKGKFAHVAPSLKTYKPFLFLGLISVMSIFLTLIIYRSTIPQAQVVFAVTNAIFMLTICSVDIGLRLRQTKPDMNIFKQYWLKPVGVTSMLFVAIILSVISSIYTVNNPIATAQTTVGNKNGLIEISYEMSTDEIIEQIAKISSLNYPTPTLGIYTDTLEIPVPKTPYIQHTFVDWRDDHYLAYALARTLQAGNTPLITIEPRGESDGSVLLQEIASGAYDAQLNKLTNIIAAANSPVYIRFAHEMELAELYSWGDREPRLYIDAYKYVMKKFEDKNSENVYTVWSPAGNKGAEVYYPGDEYVDIIGTTILYDEYWYGKYFVPRFNQIAQSRFWLKEFGKPIWVVEFGAGRANIKNQQIIIADALNNYESLGFESLVYLNLIDANIVGPDYRLDSLNEFANIYLRLSTDQIQNINNILNNFITSCPANNFDDNLMGYETKICSHTELTTAYN
jgi:cellulose synthase (UDP-forming)